MPHSLVRVLVLAAMLCGVTCGVVSAANSAGLWIDVPFVAQTGDGCGPASIAMVMQYWQQHLGQPATPAASYAAIDRVLYSPKAHGIYASAMQRYFAQNGYRAFAFTGDDAALSQHLGKGRPLIAALKPGAGLPLHYVVVVGLDPARKTVLVNDPAQRKLIEQDAATFERDWAAAGHWTLLAVPEANAR
ncbi:MAG TPA: C39 family peptidase [Terracidiphilus sp.]|jgi:predicted double-glycine peptidase|nr:C39 family peptidase [Terracidiphilus sp.]